MAITTKIRKEQLVSLEIENADVASDAAIASSKLADGLNFLKKDGSVLMTGNFDLNSNKIINLATPTLSTDAATKQYVDDNSQGLVTKDSVRVATTANINLAVGGLLTIDTIVVVAGDRVLVKDQTNAVQNGIYVAASGGWSRAADADTGAELTNAYFFVEEGSSNANSGFVQKEDTPTVGTDDITFTVFSKSTDFQAGNGLTRTGTTFDIVAASSDRIAVNADNIDLATTGVSAGDYTKVTVDTYGRVTTGATASADDITDGSTNQFFTASRARAAIIGAASTITSSNLTANRALVSTSQGKVGVSTVTSTELGYLSGVTSSIQTQLSGKQSSDPTLTTIASLSPVTDQMIYFSGADVAAATSITSFGRTLVGSSNASAARTNLGLVIGTDVQGFDADLSAIGALTGTTGLLRKTAANTYELDTAGYLTTNQDITLSGDVTGTGSTGINVSLANSGVSAGTYGSASEVPVFTVDNKGRVTSVTNTSINIITTFSGLSDTAFTTLSTDQLVKWSGTQWVNFTPDFLTSNENISLSGDASGDGTTSIVVTLANSGVAAGSDFTKFDVDAKGRVTAAGNLEKGDLPNGTLHIDDYVVNEISSTTPNGVTLDFAVANPYRENTIMVFLNGVLMTEGATEDYTLDTVGDQVQFNTPPLSGDNIRFTYFKAPVL